MKTIASEIVKDNFKELDDSLKNLIVECMKFYASYQVKKHLEIASQYAESEKVGEGYEINKESITGINIILS